MKNGGKTEENQIGDLLQFLLFYCNIYLRRINVWSLSLIVCECGYEVPADSVHHFNLELSKQLKYLPQQ